MDQTSGFRMEAAGSLTPELNGAPRSGAHTRRTKEKGREKPNEARKAQASVPPLEERTAR